MLFMLLGIVFLPLPEHSLIKAEVNDISLQKKTNKKKKTRQKQYH